MHPFDACQTCGRPHTTAWNPRHPFKPHPNAPRPDAERYRSAIGELAAKLARAQLPNATGLDLIIAATQIANDTYARHGLPGIESEQAPGQAKP